MNIMNQTKLFTPGPTVIPERVLKAMSAPVIHHRSDEFKKIFLETRKKFQKLINSESEPIFLAGSGTLAMNAALESLTEKKDKILTFNGGKFGARWGELAKTLELELLEITCPWGESFSLEKINSLLDNNTDIKVACIQHCETSTGILHPIKKIIEILKVKLPNALIVIDCITSIGVSEVNMTDLGADVIIGGSQKALMLPPGLCMLALSNRAWERVKPKTYYWNLIKEREGQAKGSPQWTPPSSIIIGLNESLSMIEEEGYDNLYKRHLDLSDFITTALVKQDFKIFTKNHTAPGLTIAYTPEGVSAVSLIQSLWDRFGIRIAGGQGAYKETIVRIGHMGHYFIEDLKYLYLAILELINEK